MSRIFSVAISIYPVRPVFTVIYSTVCAGVGSPVGFFWLLVNRKVRFFMAMIGVIFFRSKCPPCLSNPPGWANARSGNNSRNKKVFCTDLAKNTKDKRYDPLINSKITVDCLIYFVYLTKPSLVRGLAMIMRINFDMTWKSVFGH